MSGDRKLVKKARNKRSDEKERQALLWKLLSQAIEKSLDPFPCKKTTRRIGVTASLGEEVTLLPDQNFNIGPWVLANGDYDRSRCGFSYRDGVFTAPVSGVYSVKFQAIATVPVDYFSRGSTRFETIFVDPERLAALLDVMLAPGGIRNELPSATATVAHDIFLRAGNSIQIIGLNDSTDPTDGVTFGTLAAKISIHLVFATRRPVTPCTTRPAVSKSPKNMSAYRKKRSKT